MKVLVYKNGLCDPIKKIGYARQLPNDQQGAKDIDIFIQTFCASINPRYISQWRVFICNDEVDFEHVDHFVLMHEHYPGLSFPNEKIQEVNIWQVATTCNNKVAAMEKRRAKAQKRLEDAKKQNLV